MNELSVFNFENNEIRALLIDEEPWFVGKDIAMTLGYQNGSRDVNRHVDEEDRKLLTSKNYQKGTFEIPSRGLILINESGLYSLILSSKLEKVKRFKHWVTSEVLPSIRKHGAYATEATIDQIINNPDFGIQLLTTLKEEREKVKQLRLETSKQAKQIEYMQPKADYCDSVLQTKNGICISKIAKAYGKSGHWMNEYLHQKKIQFKQGDTWIPYQKYATKGYMVQDVYVTHNASGRNVSKVRYLWTQKGQKFIYDTLKADGIYPMSEIN